MKPLFVKKDNTNIVLNSLIRSLGVKVNKSTVDNCLDTHPHYPSLMSYCDCMEQWNIPTGAYQISRDSFKAEDFDYPFVAHIYDPDEKFILVKSIKDKVICYTDELEIDKFLQESEFLNKWDGIYLTASPTAESEEPNYYFSSVVSFVAKIKIPIICSLLFLIITVGFENRKVGGPYFGIFFFSVIGVAFSILLLIQLLDQSNIFFQRICNLQGSDCNAILQSKYSKITNWLSWSEVGFFYFTSSFIILLFFPGLIIFFGWFNLLSIPYTFFSIGYQLAKRSWCILCCSIQALLWAQFLVFHRYFTYHVKFPSLYEIAALFLSLIFPITIWYLLKPILLNSNKTIALNKQLNEFKYNSDVFQDLLLKEKALIQPLPLRPITIGNSDAESTITIISNPFCGPCSKAHRVLSELIETRPDIKLNILFTANHAESDIRSKITPIFYSLNIAGDKRKLEEALESWFNNDKDINTWTNDYAVPINDELRKEINEQNKWMSKAGIKGTPTIFVNGFKLPSLYNSDDLKYLV